MPETYVLLGISLLNGMTAASEHLASPTPRAPRWERLLVVLGVCLPVPLFAATGLTIPLPATVERLAASLVPWVETAMVDSNRALLGGTIVLAPGEQRESPAAPVSEPRAPTHDPGQGGGETKPANGTDSGVAPNPTVPGAGPVTTPNESSPQPSPKPDPAEKPGDEPVGPVQGTVDTIGQTVGSAVGGVDATVDEVLPPATDGLLGGGTVTGILPGLGG